MVDIWGSIKSTAKSMGGAVAAPAGAVVDLAQMPFDNKDDDFGSLVDILGKNAGAVLDPIVNPSTISGGAVHKALQAMDWAWLNVASEPLATANMVNRHVFGGYGNVPGPLGWAAATVTGNAHWGELFDAGTWSAAYERANQQHEALGAAFAYGALNPKSDPLAVENPYEDAKAEHGAWATGLATTGEIAGMFAADPTFLALKGVGAARMAYDVPGLAAYAKLSVSQRANMMNELTAGSRAGRLRVNLQTRTDKYLDWINGKNALGRGLSAKEIHYGTPELTRYAKDPEAVAGFLADAQKIDNVAQRRNVQRGILAVAAGDVSQIERVRGEGIAAQSLRDQLANMERGSVIDLDAMAVDPALMDNPVFRMRLESQLKNLNTAGDLDKFMSKFQSYNDRLLESQHTLPNAPGVHSQGERAVNRLNDRGIARLPKKLQENTLDSWSAALAQRAQSTSGVFQKGKYTVPLVAVKTVGLGASVYTKAPVAISDALRRTSYTGVASIHDWSSSAEQLNAMMIRAEVPHGERMGLLNDTYLAATESEKAAIINKVEARSMKGLTDWAASRNGKAVSENYLTELMRSGSTRRSNKMTALQGRAYAATRMPEEMIPRNAQGVEDATSLSQTTGMGSFSAKKQGEWRLDHINDDGTPLAMPVFETQLGNHIPLIDIDLARRAVARDTGYLSRLSRAWEAESKELGRLADLKAKGASGLDNLIRSRAAARDMLVDFGQKALRVWKFGVLFRLGYPMRVVTDDHLRIISKIGAASFYGPNAKEYARNFAYNRGRKYAGNLGLHDDKILRSQLREQLDSPEMLVHPERVARVKEIDKLLEQLRGGGLARVEQEAAASGREVLYHGGLPEHATLDDIDLGRVGSQQGKRDRSYGGFYLANGGDARAKAWADKYSTDRNGVMHGLVLRPDARVKTTDKVIDRLSAEERAALSKDFDAITGKDALGRTQTVLLNKGAVESFGVANAQGHGIAAAEAEREYLLEQLGDVGPADLAKQIAEVEARIKRGPKAYRPAKATIGQEDVTLADGTTFPGVFGDQYADVFRAASGSGGTFERTLEGAEERTYRSISGGAHRTIQPEEPAHLGAWADALNNQIGMSRVGRFFLKGGTPEDFVKWLRESEQATLRRRVAHFAHDPEDWGNRAYGIVHDYVPNEAVQQALLKGRVTPQQLEKMIPDEGARPAVHGRAAADNLGDASSAVQAFGRGMNRLFGKLSATPTDTLSRHPYFNSMYRLHLQDMYNVRRASRAGGEWTAKDATDIARAARQAALRDLKKTLYDLSAHSHAAHVMRFISPFFGAHQEGVARWWRIAADNPAIVRRFTQIMDVPRALHLVVDENGDLVEPGTPLSSQHRILIQRPPAFGGKDPEDHYDKDGKFVPGFQSKWAIRESSFNIILQGGLTNPGAGPIVTAPLDYFAQKYADEPNIARVARVFNPFPANSPMENLAPAAAKRLSAYIYGETGVDPSLGLGIGKREYNFAMAQNVQDRMVDFQLENGREPTYKEAQAIESQAADETNSMMFHRFLWNAGTPTPAAPRSKYAVIQQGWYKIQEQAKAENRDFDWAYGQFKEKYGPAYLPLISSTANNPAWVDANAADVSAIKHYKPLLESVDPALTRMVIGAYSADLIEKDATLGDYSVDARNFLRDEQIKPGDSTSYYSYDDPAKAVYEQMARRGWAKYGALTAGLTAIAQAQGLTSYEDNPQLVALKQAGVKQLQDENYAFRDDWGAGFDAGEYDRLLDSMRIIADAKVFKGDASRSDVEVLNKYLALRDLFSQALQARKDAGLGGPDAQAQAPMRQAYTALVDGLVEGNTYFQEHMYNGTIERDPLLLREVSP